ncbi:signal peptide peptidase SppA [Chelativorans sp. Marseille-P2723]|uniref:signal peptide peptidase SppA n=1 Tax=Chelativorans sp. Marseille-P2723 TaxID=2709133 RepID=UPI001570E8AB|nr:signal peptide peptidase SppA [Chelativorans sp. Marseille-P2723]
MSTRADDLVDRRRLRRKLTFWRAAAFIVLALALAASVRWLMADRLGLSSEHIARVRIEGTITEDERLLEVLENLRKSKTAAGVIVTINSPGGTTAGGEAVYEAVRRLAAEKPVAAQIGTLAASAAYLVANATDHIVARQTSIVGSIGVIIQFPEITELLNKIGVKVEEVKSSPLKAEPSPFNPTTDEERQMLRAMLLDSYNWFVDIIAERRPLTRAEALSLSDGSIFTGRQAVELKLVDALGGEHEARAWLNKQGVSEDLEIVEWKPRESGGFPLLPGFATSLAEYIGLSRQNDLVRLLGVDRIFLDGLLSLWQPEKVGLPE